MRTGVQITHLHTTLWCKCPRCKKRVIFHEGSRVVKCSCGTVLVGEVMIAPTVVAYEPWECWYCHQEIPFGVSHDTSTCTEGR